MGNCLKLSGSMIEFDEVVVNIVEFKISIVQVSVAIVSLCHYVKWI